MLALLVALVSPIDGLGEDYLFSAHMVQHVLLGDIAPLLLLLSPLARDHAPATRRLHAVERALGPLAQPGHRHRRSGSRSSTSGTSPRCTTRRWSTRPSTRSSTSRFFTAGVALWWPLIQPVPMRRAPDRACGRSPTSPPRRSGWPRSGSASPGARPSLYPYYEHVPRIWGLSPIEDQNVGGAIMMVEQSLTLVIAFVVLFVRMLRQQ